MLLSHKVKNSITKNYDVSYRYYYQVSYNGICEFRGLCRIHLKWAKGYQMQVWWFLLDNYIVMFEMLIDT